MDERALAPPGTCRRPCPASPPFWHRRLKVVRTQDWREPRLDRWLAASSSRSSLPGCRDRQAAHACALDSFISIAWSHLTMKKGEKVLLADNLLMHACRHGHWEVVQMLLLLGCNATRVRLLEWSNDTAFST